MGPRHAFAQIDTLNNAIVKTENIKIDTSGAGADDHAIDFSAGNIGFDQVHAFFAAKERVGGAIYPFIIRNSDQRFHVEGITDSTACAYIYTIFFLIHDSPLPPYKGLNGLKGHTCGILVGCYNVSRFIGAAGREHAAFFKVIDNKPVRIE